MYYEKPLQAYGSSVSRKRFKHTILVLLLLSAPIKAYGQTATYQYHEEELGNVIYAQCGFCPDDRYGAIFYEFMDSGLTSDKFPLSVEGVRLAFTTTEFVGELCSADVQPASRFTQVDVDVYAGEVVPVSVSGLPALGPWPQEFVVTSTRTWMQRSDVIGILPLEFHLMWNYVKISQVIPAPYKYIRVVITVPRGSASDSNGCGHNPGISPFTDGNGFFAPHRNLLYDSNRQDWWWAEEFRIAGQGFRGDWFLGINVKPSVSPSLDAGMTPQSDAGRLLDAGLLNSADSGSFVLADAGIAILSDAGLSEHAPSISRVSPNLLVEQQGGLMRVTGSRFRPDLTLYLNNVQLDVHLIHNESMIIATIPANLPQGFYDVVVQNKDGQTANMIDGFYIQGFTQTEKGCSCTTEPSILDGTFWIFWMILFGGFLARCLRRI